MATHKYYNELIKDRQQTQQVSYESSMAFDKYIVTLASGAFAISLTFVVNGFLGKDHAVKSLFWLGVAYFGFGTSILSTLGSYLFSHFNSKLKIKAIDDLIPKISILTSKNYKIQINRIAKGYIFIANWILALNFASYVFFAFGLFCLAKFVISNLPSV